MRIAITGSTGLLGTSILDVISEKHPDWELLCLSRKQVPSNKQKTWKSLDITDYEATYQTITRFNPDCVIHAAAMRSPDQCEQNEKEAYRVNFLGTRNVALACDRFDTELVLISSDQVFYGAKESRDHREYDATCAKNIYGQTKIWAEQYIQNHLRRYWIIRTAKLFGGPGDHLASFPTQMTEAIRKNKKMKVTTDWFGHLTYAPDFALALLGLIQRKTYGIYHLTSPNIASYYEIAQWITKKLKRGAELIEEVSFEDLNLPAHRAKRCVLDTQLWELEFGNKLPIWQEEMEKFLRSQR